MAASTISFRGTTIWTDGTDGAGYEFTPDSQEPLAEESAPDVGVGYFLKPGNTAPANHTLQMAWLVASPATLKATIDGLAGITRGALVVPEWGTYANCRLLKPDGWSSFKSEGSNYIVRATLRFRQYP